MPLTFRGQRCNPLTPRIWFLILPSSCYIFPFKLVARIWCLIKIITFTWYIWELSLPVCRRVDEYCREKLHANHFWELKGQLTFWASSSCPDFHVKVCCLENCTKVHSLVSMYKCFLQQTVSPTDMVNDIDILGRVGSKLIF